MKTKIKVLISALLILIVTGCSNKNDLEKHSSTIFAMDTYITLDLYGENAEKAADDVESKINKLENMWSTTIEGSEIYSINNSSNNETVISSETADILNFALNMSEKTNGALDISLYPVIKEWGFTTGAYKIPSNEEITTLLKNVGYSNIKINDNKVSVPDNMEIDLGAVGKGYTGDIAVNIAKNNGIKSGLINLGSNVCAIGKKPDDSNWKIGLKSPFSDGNIGVLEISDCSVVTSGNYEKFFEDENGKKYCHIINPETGLPVDNGLASVTVIGTECKLVMLCQRHYL
ncbi:MAG: FAD:protein FMN transferase [Lachnospirales bacterium]